MDPLRRLFTRRRFLQALGLGAGGLALRGMMPAWAANGVPNDDGSPFLVICSFNGGWDQLLALDPRDTTLYTSGSIVPATQQLADGLGDEGLSAFMGLHPSGFVQPAGSPITLGAAARSLEPFAQELCLVRGINMGTLTHDVGRRYFLTGRFPQGLAANGSSLPTAVVQEVGGMVGASNLPPIPNLAVGTESYNAGLDTYATGLQVSSSLDLRGVLYAFDPLLEEGTVPLLDTYFEAATCGDELYDGGGQVTAFKDSRLAAKVLGGGTLEGYFDFSQQNDLEGMEELYGAFGLANLSQQQFQKAKTTPIEQAMIAAQAITKGVSQAVSVTLAQGIDHHDEDYGSDHYPALYQGFDALARLIGFLQAQGVWDRTTLLVTSEFARTPTLNPRGGRDHHLSSSCLLAGQGIEGNQVIGKTDDATYVYQPIDPATGQEDDQGVSIRPPDIHATLLDALGMPYDHLSNQSPVLIDAIRGEAG